MRLTSNIWFAVFMRRETQRGAYVSVIKRGADEAGALFIIHNHLNGSACLYAPAPQSLVEREDGERCFERVLENQQTGLVEQYLEKQRAFDPDLWIIETESGSGSPSLEIVNSG